MSKKADELEFRKNNFYRDHYRRTLRLVIFFGLSALVLAGVLVYLSVRKVSIQSYATTTSGRIVRLHALNEPVVTSNFILQWVSLATRKALNLNFVDYEQQMRFVRPNFTAGGWDSFKKALKGSGLLSTVLNKKLIMSAVVSGTPVILNRQIVHGRYTWTVNMPVLVSFTSANQHEQMKLLVTMYVQRVPTLDSAQGIQISGFIAKNAVY